jgi:hypothetical protein
LWVCHYTGDDFSGEHNHACTSSQGRSARQAIDPRAVDQLADLGDLDLSATSLTSGLLPAGLRRPGTNEVDAILVEPAIL